MRFCGFQLLLSNGISTGFFVLRNESALIERGIHKNKRLIVYFGEKRGRLFVESSSVNVESASNGQISQRNLTEKEQEFRLNGKILMR